MWNRIVEYILVVGLAVVLVSKIPVWSQPKDIGGSAIEHVEPPKGSILRYVRDDAGGIHYEYLAPPEFNENPIVIHFDPNAKKPKPDVYVWADVIHWNNTTQSATATGRIVVDSEKYRIESSYAEYNHVTRQVYCPKRVVVIQKLPTENNSRIEAESAILKLDDQGIKEVKFDKILNTRVYIEGNKGSIVETPKPKSESKDDSSSQKLPGPSGISGPAD